MAFKRWAGAARVWADTVACALVHGFELPARNQWHSGWERFTRWQWFEGRRILVGKRLRKVGDNSLDGYGRSVALVKDW